MLSVISWQKNLDNIIFNIQKCWEKKIFRYVLQKVQDQDILEFGKQDRELELFPSLQSSLNV